MKKVLKKMFVLFLILLIINNIFIGISYAANDEILEIFAGILGGVVGFLTWPLRALAMLGGWIIDKFSAIVAYTEGATDPGTDTLTITPFDIFFNKVKLLDINFFDITTDSNFINTMRTNVASWYYVMRIIASAILLVILVYVGIRMAVSTVASDKAAYKKMLVDWVCSLALVFLLHYIIIFAINVNNSIVKVIENSVNNTNVANTYKEIFKMGFNIDLLAIGATVIYIMLVWQTFGLIVSYFNRMLKIAFLIIISPLVTITYSIDKMGDGKAQALNIWLKEIIFTILIQPFHCIIYMSLVDTAFNLLSKASDPIDKLGRAVVAIIMIRFVKEGEKIVRKIFDFKDDNSKTSVAVAMATTGVMINQAKNFGKTARSVGRGAVNVGKGLKSFGRNGLVEGIALGSLVLGKKNESGQKMTFKEAKEDINAKATNLEAKVRAGFKYKVVGLNKKGKELEKDSGRIKEGTAILASDIEAEKENIKAQHNGAISDKEATAQARLNLVKKKRKENGFANRNIKKAKGFVKNKTRKVGEKMSPATKEVLATLSDMGKDYLKVSASGAAGLLVGAGLYGTGKDIFSSVAIGSATGKGVHDLTTRTKTTLSNNIRGYLDNLGIRGEKASRQEIQSNILNEKNKFAPGEEANKERQKIVDELNKALEGFGVDSKTRSEINNTIMSDLQNNPSIAPDSIKNTINRGLKGTGKTFENISNNDAVKKVMEYSNRNAIYNEIQTAEEINVSSSELIEKVASSYDKDDESLIVADEAYEDIREIEVYDEDGNYDENAIDEKIEQANRNNDKKRNLDESEITRLHEKYEEEINRILEEIKITKDGDDKEELEKILNRTQMEQMQVIARLLQDKKAELHDYNQRLLIEYRNKIDDAVAKRPKDIADKQFEKLVKLQADLNS